MCIIWRNSLHNLMQRAKIFSNVGSMESNKCRTQKYVEIYMYVNKLLKYIYYNYISNMYVTHIIFLTCLLMC